MTSKSNFMLRLAVLEFATVALSVGSAGASLIGVSNNSFEDPVYAPGGSGFLHPGWTDFSGNPGTGSTTPAQYPGGIPDGVNYAWFNQSNDVLSQTLAFDLQADTIYTLTVATGWRTDLPGAGYPNYPGYGIELRAGGVLLASDYDTDAGNSGPVSGTWKDVMATYTSPASVTPGQALEIRLLAGAAVNGGTAVQTNYDHVRLDAVAIPEPATLALMGAGSVLLLVLLRRR